MMKFILITNDPALAHHAESCGVERIFVDLEQHGKQERQGHLNTLISSHTMADVASVKASISGAEILVRLNPLHTDTRREVDAAIRAGADLLMLPMFRSAVEVRQFTELVEGRAGVIPLVETGEAVDAINEIVCIAGVSEIYIGLNDLHLDIKMRFIFEPLANGLIDKLAEIIKLADLPFGFGGVARVGEGVIPGELVLGEHIRLGSSSVILSRTFCGDIGSNISANPDSILMTGIQQLKNAVELLKLRSQDQVESDCRRLRKLVEDVIDSKANETSV